MTTPILIVERFLVFRDDEIVFDQKFHKGVNIIRGVNSTGKSTVMDLLYYSLGGELKQWTSEQENCTHLLVEVLISGARYCLKREIKNTGKAAMLFFEGSAEESLKDSKNWFSYPNARSDNKHSYSQQLFDLLGLPQHQTEFSNNLTMHQILRLIYVDQLTDTTQLLNKETEYDNPTIRKAIGDYLLSVDDLEAHKLRQQLIDANKFYEAINGELIAITKILRREEQVFHVEKLEADIRVSNEEISSLEQKEKEVRGRKLESLETEVQDRSREISSKIEELSFERRNLIDMKATATAERLDTLGFMQSVRERLVALEHSSITNNELGEVAFDYCPSCLTALDVEIDSDSCNLCKSEISSEKRQFANLQMINELQFQLRESESLIPSLEKEIDHANVRVPQIEREIERLKVEYQSLTENADTTEAVLYEIASEIGFLKSNLCNLNEKLEFAQKIEELRAKKEDANGRITKIKERLLAIEADQENRKIRTYASIEKIAKSLLMEDGGYEESFKNPDEISFDFAKNKMFVNGRSKFSASSMVIMKNAIRAAIFLQSVKDSTFRFPRLMLNDNIEDKGMTPERSHSFQKNLVKLCDELSSDYQLIFTTSMISPELDKNDYVAGPFYEKGMHTLKVLPGTSD